MLVADFTKHKHIFMKFNLQTLLIVLLLTFGFQLHAQRLKLVDLHSGQPIDGATFKYGDISGISDQKGFISITFIEKVSMEISHLNYGSWSLSPEEVKTALKSSIIYREQISLNLLPVTVVAIHSNPGNKAVLSLNSRDRLSHDGADILNSIEGFSSIRKSASYGFDPVFRGFKNEQLNIIINGAQTATAACPNRMDPPSSQVAPNMISHIEVQKGPHSLRYGNSFGATVNYIPVAPRFGDKVDVYGRITGSYETNGEIIRNEGVVGISGKKYDLSLFGSFGKGSDYKDGDANSIPARFSRSSAGINLGLKLTDKQFINASATRNFARDTDFPALPMDLRSDDTWLFNVRHEANLSGNLLKSWKSAAYATIVDHKMDNLLKNLNPRIMNASTPAKTSTWGARTEGHWSAQNFSLFAGGDFRIENSQGERTREFIAGPNAGKTFYDNVWQNGTISRSGLFAEFKKNYQAVTAILSGRLELNQSGIGDGASEFINNYGETSETQVNPALSLGAVTLSKNGYSAGLWLGTARRSGSMTERFINYFPVGQDAYELLGNPLIKPETNNQADLNLSYKSPKTIISADIFASLVNDYISAVIDTSLKPRLMGPGVRRFVNIKSAFRTGFELSWKQTIMSVMQQKVAIAYTYGQNTVTDEPLPEIAPMEFRYSLTGAFFKEKLRPSLHLRHTLEQNRVSSEFGESKTPAFTLLDVNLYWQITKIISAGAGVTNLFDVAYYEHLNRPIGGTPPKPIYAPGRSIFVSLSVDLY